MNISYNEYQHELVIDNEIIELTETENDIVKCLIDAKGKYVNKADILEYVNSEMNKRYMDMLSDREETTEIAIKSHICHINRKTYKYYKYKSPMQKGIIVMRKCVGYKIIEEINNDEEELNAIDNAIMTDFDNLVNIAIKHIYRDNECSALQKIIKKQQKEIEELQKDKKALVKNYDIVLGTFISKDKIRKQIKELENIIEFEKPTYEDYLKYTIDILEDLLEENKSDENNI